MLDNKGTCLWTSVNGHGLATIFCNGGPGCDDYLGAVSVLIEDQCRVVRFEPRGCGRSDWDGCYDLNTTIEDIEFIRRAYNLERIVLVGHSAGPGVALAYTIRYPENVLGIIGIAGPSVVNDRDWSATYHRNLERDGEDYGGKVFIADEDVNKLGNETWTAFIKRPALLRELSQLSVPAIFINASNDIRPNWPTQQIANLIPRGEYHEIEGAAHCIWLTHAEELRRKLIHAISVITSYQDAENIDGVRAGKD